MARVIATKGVASWGITGTCDKVAGIITDIDVTEDPIMQAEHNEVGGVVNQVQYDTHTTYTVTVQVAAATDKPAVGTVITINSKTCMVKNARIIEGNMAFRKIEVTAEAYTNFTGPAVAPAV